RPLPEDAMIIVPVRNTVLFPGMVLPLGIGRAQSIAAVQEAVRLERPVGILLQSKSDAEEPSPSDLHRIGTTAQVLRYVTAADGAHHAICRGVQRFRVLQFLDGFPFTVASVQLIPDAKEDDPEVEGRARTLKERAAQVLELLPQVPPEVAASI